MDRSSGWKIICPELSLLRKIMTSTSPFPQWSLWWSTTRWTDGLDPTYGEEGNDPFEDTSILGMDSLRPHSELHLEGLDGIK